MPDPKCILTNPETDCIKNAGEQLKEQDLQKTNGLSTENTGKAFGVGLSYLTSLVSMDPKIIKDKCGTVLGNKFLYEYGKCKDNTGKTQTRYKYIDATCEAGGTFGGTGAGLIPCTINSALGVGESAVGIPTAIFQDSVPPCELKSVSCKVSNKGQGTFNGDTYAYIANGDYGSSDNPAPVGFENLYESVNDYMKNNDLDFNNIDENMNINNMNIGENINIDNNFKSDTTLNEMYYIMLMIFFLFIIYKLMHKK
tara:strand:- start:4455 stop:5216 length:762 start_codon:yes stop_codon:yes gene_type:complete